MRVGALGGCGDMGSRAVGVLAATDDVTEVLVLDRAADRGRELARLPRVTFAEVDATDHAALGPLSRFVRA